MRFLKAVFGVVICNPILDLDHLDHNKGLECVILEYISISR